MAPEFYDARIKALKKYDIFFFLGVMEPHLKNDMIINIASYFLFITIDHCYTPMLSDYMERMLC